MREREIPFCDISAFNDNSVFAISPYLRCHLDNYIIMLHVSLRLHGDKVVSHSASLAPAAAVAARLTNRRAHEGEKLCIMSLLPLKKLGGIRNALT